jgi:Galactose oxidase, central domain
MEIPCYSQACSNPIQYKCSCTASPGYFCKDHSILHCQEPGNHKLVASHFKLDNVTKANFIKKALEKRNAISQIRKKLALNTKEIISFISEKAHNQINSLIEEELKLSNSIEIACDRDEIYLDEFVSYLSSEDYDFVVNYSLLDMISIKQKISDAFSFEFIKCLKLVPSRDYVKYSKSFNFFSRSSKKLIRFDIPNLEYSKTQVNIETNEGNLAGWCLLPDKKVFHYGGQVGALSLPLNTCNIINPVSKKVERKSNGLVRKYTIGVCQHYNGDVYVFGGSGVVSVLLSDSEKYNLAADTWTSIQPMPLPSDYNSTFLLRKNIFITGYRMGVYIYNPQTNSYTQSIEDVDGQKIMIGEGNKLYIIHRKTLIEYVNDSWTKVNSSINIFADKYLISYPVNYQKWIYFLLSDNKLYRFDISNSSIEIVKKI